MFHKVTSKQSELLLRDYTSRHNSLQNSSAKFKSFPYFERSCSPKAANAESQDRSYVLAALKNKLQRSHSNGKRNKNCNTCTSPAKSRQLDYNILQ